MPRHRAIRGLPVAEEQWSTAALAYRLFRRLVSQVYEQRQRIGLGTMRKQQKRNPCRYSRQGLVHVDEERRAVLRPVAPQRPCLLIEAVGAKPLKIIY